MKRNSQMITQTKKKPAVSRECLFKNITGNIFQKAEPRSHIIFLHDGRSFKNKLHFSYGYATVFD